MNLNWYMCIMNDEWWASETQYLNHNLCTWQFGLIWAFVGKPCQIAVVSRVPDVQLNPDQLGLHCIYMLWTTKHIGMKHVDLSDWVAGSLYWRQRRRIASSDKATVCLSTKQTVVIWQLFGKLTIAESIPYTMVFTNIWSPVVSIEDKGGR